MKRHPLLRDVYEGKRVEAEPHSLGTPSAVGRFIVRTLAIWPAPQAGSRQVIEVNADLSSMTYSISPRVAQGGVGKSSGLSFGSIR